MSFCLFRFRMKNITKLWTGIVLLQCVVVALAADPKFDPTTRMRLVLVPADATVGSVIYRLRASDEEFDYPLTFELVGMDQEIRKNHYFQLMNALRFVCSVAHLFEKLCFLLRIDGASSSTVQIENLECTKYNSICQANVILVRRLEPGRYYDFKVSVKDTKGGMTQQSCSITATNYTTPHDLIFPHKAGIIMVPEVIVVQFLLIYHEQLKISFVFGVIFFFFLINFHISIRTECKARHNARLCHCTKKSTVLEGCDFRVAWIAIVCHSPKNRITANNRRNDHFARPIGFWNEIHVSFDHTCKRKCYATPFEQNKRIFSLHNIILLLCVQCTLCMIFRDCKLYKTITILFDGNKRSFSPFYSWLNNKNVLLWCNVLRMHMLNPAKIREILLDLKWLSSFKMYKMCRQFLTWLRQWLDFLLLCCQVIR